MPIRNLTERRRLPRLGKIHLGIKVDGAKGQYPKAVDYFVCPLEVQEAYGEKPKELEIMFISNDVEACASQYYRAYKQTTGLVCKGDGYRADALLDTDRLKADGGEIKATSWASSTSKHVLRQGIDCLGEGFEGEAPCPLYAVKGCKRLMMLQFVILRVPGIGVWQIDTVLAAQSIATPVTTPASFVSFLLNLNARGAAALADMAAFPESDGGPGSSTHGQTLWKLYQQGLDGLKDGTAIDPAVSDSGQEPTAETYLTENPDNDPYADGFSDGEQPVFSMTRQLRDF